MLRAEIVKKPVVFTLHIENVTETLRKISLFFEDRGIIIDDLQMHRYRNSEASLIIHCQVPKEDIRFIAEQIKQLPGIIELQKMQES